MVKFTISPFYYLDNTPVYNVVMEDGVLGKANRNGSIIVSKDLDPDKAKEVVDHEKVHLDQMNRGDLDYDDENVYWKGNTYSRNKIKEGAKNLPWEKEAYKNA